MCGIIGFTGKKEAQDILLDGLAKLEYRGYDSAGIAFFKDNGGHISIIYTYRYYLNACNVLLKVYNHM